MRSVNSIKQRGMSLVLALFILVVLSLLGVAMINILAGGAESVAREVISARALFAAESGAQRKLNELFPPGAGTNINACAVTPTKYSATDFLGITGCSTLMVTVRCSRVTTDVNTVNYFTINSEASCGPANEPAVRVIEVQAKDGF